MKKLYAFLLVTLCTTSYSQYPTWQNLGPSDFSDGTVYDLEIETYNNEVYVAYSDALHSYKAVVKKFDGTNWVNLGSSTGISAGNASFIDLKFDNIGTPYVVYRDATNGNEATCQKWNGSNWVVIGSAGFTPSSISYTSIALNSSNQPYVAYSEAWNLQEITVKTFDGTNWIDVGNTSFGGDGALDISIDFDGNDVPYVSYRSNQTSGKAAMVKLVGSTWTNIGPSNGFTPSGASKLTLKFNGNDPVVGFRDGAQNQKASVMTYNGTNWVNIGNPGISPFDASNIELTIESTGNPVISFGSTGNGEKLTVMRFEGSTWDTIGTSYFSENQYSGDQSITVDDNDIPYVVYKNNGNTDKVIVMSLQPCAETNSSMTATACYESVSPSGNYTWTTSGIYTDTLSNITGCDSIITVNLSVQLDSNVTQNGATLSSDAIASGITYQWVDCGNGFMSINGENNQSFTASTDGDYAVVITNGSCTDTSSCFNIAGVGMNELSESSFTLYPNPVRDRLYLESSSEIIRSIGLYSTEGKLIYTYTASFNNLDTSRLLNGTYILKIQTEQGVIHKQFIKQ